MLIRRYSASDDEQWAPVSDLMAVVMLIFMLIAMILFVNFDSDRIKNERRCEQTKQLLDDEFSQDFKDWGAVLEEDLTIRFTNQRVLFPSDSSDVGGWFAVMLKDFFPRYMVVMNKIRNPNQFGEDEILAIRIEGHTSSEYDNPGKVSPFIKNMELSQDRARKILQYVLHDEKVPESRQYNQEVVQLITANGLSSSRLICTASGEEDRSASRRVEFKLLTKSCQKAGKYEAEKLAEHPCRQGAYDVD